MTERLGLGWHPDVPDHRDRTIETSQSARALLRSAGIGSTDRLMLPSQVDLRSGFSPIENQGSLGSCTQNAYVGLLEYFQKKTFGKHVNMSRLFGYWTTRKLMGLTGDSGASLRDTMKAGALFGLPMEQYWPYRIADFEKEPTPFVFAIAQSFQALEYYRLDPSGVSTTDLLARIKANLSVGLPSMFGTPWYSCADQAETNGGSVPYPTANDQLLGGHAVCVAGFNDEMVIANSNDKSKTVGAFLCRNSWGVNYANRGYFWYPFEYILKGLALDWWSLVKAEWVDLQVFV